MWTLSRRHAEPQIVGLAVHEPRLHASAGHHHREAVGEVVAAQEGARGGAPSRNGVRPNSPPRR